VRVRAGEDVRELQLLDLERQQMLGTPPQHGEAEAARA